MSEISEIIEINEAKTQSHLGDLVKSAVEDTLNALLDAEADELCGAERYERSPDRQNTCAGHYECEKLQTKPGEVELKVPRLWDAIATAEPPRVRPASSPDCFLIY